MPTNNLVGKTFGELIVLKFDTFKSINTASKSGVYKIKTPFWLCQCKCGRNKSIREYDLLRGHSTSCGCKCGYNIHGMSYTLTYKSWSNMKARCLNPKNINYKNYGGKGIIICKFLLESPKNLFNLIGKRPNKSYDLDRINNKGNYTCGKCEECLKNNWSLNIQWLYFIKHIDKHKQQDKKEIQSLFII